MNLSSNPQKSFWKLNYGVQDHAHLLLACMFLFSDIIGGWLRFALGSTELGILIYVPKALLLAALPLFFVAGVYRGRLSAAFLGSIVIFGVFAIVGLIFVDDPAQTAFGLWTIIPFLFGTLLRPMFFSHLHQLKNILALFWLVAVTGVFLDFMYHFEWAGTTYEFAGTELETAKQWWIGEFDRVAGFSRASYAVADQILFLSLFVVCFANKPYVRATVWLIGGAAIAVTTTKTVIGIFLVLTIFLLVRPILIRAAWRPLPSIIAVLGIALPFSVSVITYKFDINDEFNILLFRSFGERLTTLWPKTIELVVNEGNFFFGRGLGGIGAAQQYFEPELYSPADSLYLYLYALGGWLGIASILVYAVLAGRLNPKKNKTDSFFAALVIAVLLRGIATNVLEGPFLALFAGASVQYVFWRAATPLKYAHKGAVISRNSNLAT